MTADGVKTPRTKARAIDWEDLRRRLARARAGLEGGGAVSAERRREIMAERTRRAAAEPVIAAAQRRIDIVEFMLAHERYGIESQYVREIAPLRHYTPVPGAPAFVLGMINLHGEILSVVDLRRFFDLPDPGLTDLNKIIVLHDDRMEFGILADAVEGAGTLAEEELQPLLPTLTGVRAEFSRAVAGARVIPRIILDARRILSDPRLALQGGSGRG
jgi:purine-binding chemotaxis protein CheW